MRRLKHLRVLRFMTQQQMATAVGVPLYTYQRWEMGRTFPRPEHLRRLCEVLEVGPDDLVVPEDLKRKAVA